MKISHTLYFTWQVENKERQLQKDVIEVKGSGRGQVARFRFGHSDNALWHTLQLNRESGMVLL